MHLPLYIRGREYGDGMATFPFGLKWKGSGIATSTFYPKGDWNYDEIATSPFCLDGKGVVMGWPPLLST